MRRYCIAFWLAAVIPVIAAEPGRAKTGSEAAQSDTSWAKVEQLRLGQTIRVVCSDQRTWTGRLKSVSADGLVLDVSGTERKTDRSDILRADVKSRVKSVLIGLGIGAGLGAGVGAAAGNSLKSGEKATAVGLGAVLFAPVGAVLGALTPSWKAVYQREP